MATVHIKRNIGSGFGEPVAELFRIMNIISQYDKNEEIIIDLQHCQFLHPFVVLTLFTFQRKLSKQGYNIRFNNEFMGNVAIYLKYIYFNEGFLPENFLDNYEPIMRSYESRTYIPIVSFPARQLKEQADIRDKFLGVLGQILRKQMKAEGQLYSALVYLLDESVNNIRDHADEDRGYVFAQCYPAAGYMDICIADTGISILGTYQKAGKYETSQHTEALQFALKGISTKDEATGRGFGIRTSRNMLVNGLGGNYMLLSGNAVLLHRYGKEEIITLEENVYWQGTVVYMRIPAVAGRDFKYTDFTG